MQGAPDILLKQSAAGQVERRDVFRFTPGKNTFQCGGGCVMPAENCGRDASLRRPVGSARLRQASPRQASRPYLWKIQFSQSLFRITRDELSVARGN